MTYEADQLKEILRIGWSLTGSLSAENTPASNGINRPIKFYAREQIKDKIESKGIEINKSTPIISQKNTEFFTEETDEFTIKIIKKLNGTSVAGFDESETDVELMELEVNRIIQNTFNVQSGIGIFWTSDLTWRDADEINKEKSDPYIVRILTLRLTRIISRNSNTFDSLHRGILFDISQSDNMDSPPASDFDYLEVFDIEDTEGFRDVELDVTENPDGLGIPLYYAGAFSGILVMNAYVNESDIGTTSDKINQIYKRQSNGEKIEAAIVRSYTNNNSKTLFITSFIRVQSVRIVEPKTNLMTFQILAKIVKPSIMTVT